MTTPNSHGNALDSGGTPTLVIRVVRAREGVSRLLTALHLHWLSGWWDAGTDARRTT